MKPNKLPEYILQSLKAHGNTIIALPTMVALGGVDGLLFLLKAKGFNCKVRDGNACVGTAFTSSNFKERKPVKMGEQFTGKVYDHVVIEEVRS